MSELVIVCPHCHRMFEYIPEAAGRYMHCHGCHVDVPVPLTTITPGLQLEDEYVVREKLGAGNVSDVFVVDSLRGPTRMRLKALTLMATRDKEATSAFFTTIAKASEPGMPEIPKVIEFGQAADVYYYIGTTYHEGQCLDQLVNRNGPMSEEDAMAYVMRIVSVLQRLWHNHNFIHRNLRPGNVLVTPTGEIILLDAGADKRLLVDAATGLGRMNTRGDLTAYTAPELLGDDVEVDPRVDIYAVGGLLLYLLTGQAPEINDKSTQRIGHLCKEAGLPPPSAQCTQFIRAAMADDPNMRPGDWKEALLMLRRTTDTRTDAGLAGHPSKLRAPRAVPEDGKGTERPKRQLLIPIVCSLLAIILVCGVSGIVYFIATNRSPTDTSVPVEKPTGTVQQPTPKPQPTKPTKRVEPGITGVFLIDSQTGKEVMELKKNAVIQLARIPRYVAIRVDATEATKSVHFIWDGKEIADSTVPFSPTGESKGVYKPWDIKNGVTSFSVSPWSQKGVRGRRGIGRQVEVHVIGERTGPPAIVAFWGFTGKTTHGFRAVKHLEKLKIADNALKLKITGGDAHFQKNKMSLPAWYISKITIYMRSTKPGRMKLKFHTNERSMGRSISPEQSVPGDNRWREHTFEIGSNVFKEGELLQVFRIYPLKGDAVQGADVEIRWIRFHSK